MDRERVRNAPPAGAPAPARSPRLRRIRFAYGSRAATHVPLAGVMDCPSDRPRL